MSFSVPPQTWQGVPLSGQAWFDQVKPFIDRFSADVEWWSPMNEPGPQGVDVHARRRLRSLADFSMRLKAYLEQSPP